MRIQLDTHLLLWWLDGDRRLSKAVASLIGDPANAVYVSAVSLWEIRLKESLGKLKLPKDFEAKLADESFESLPLTAEHTRLIARLPWYHRDPFDRMLIAQAQAEGLVFLTADATLAPYGATVKSV